MIDREKDVLVKSPSLKSRMCAAQSERKGLFGHIIGLQLTEGAVLVRTAAAHQ